MEGTVLILDYSEFERDKIRYILSLISSFKIVEISSVNEYYPLMDKLTEISLIIMDICYPTEEEGFEILGQIKMRVGQNVPIIIATKSKKLENRNIAQKYAVYDYIIKPYNSIRMKSSIRSILNIEEKFYYNTEKINKLSLTFDQFVNRELATAETINLPLTILIISALGTFSQSYKEATSFSAQFESFTLAFSIASDTIKPLLSVSDSLFINGNKDILILLPFTTSDYAKLCSDKIISSIDEELKKINFKYSDFFYCEHVTYPENGRTFQELMKTVFNKIANRGNPVKMNDITENTKENAKRRYNQFVKWF